MENFTFQKVEVIENISKNDFLQLYVKPQIPVVVKGITKNWKAYSDWNLDYIKQIAGEKTVPLYDNSPVDATKKVNEPIAQMKLAEYINLLQKGPTQLRIFLFNIIKEVPVLQNDFTYPDLGLKLLKSLPMLFFGGQNSKVFMHYDIDLANILHFHFGGKKECKLVSPQDSKNMYKVPYAWISREDIDFETPDFEKFPALQNIQPFLAKLEHGDMLYMPEGYWHYMTYKTPGFSMSLRALPQRPKNFFQAIINVVFVRTFDNGMRKIRGNKWIAYKDKLAIKRVEKLFQK